MLRLRCTLMENPYFAPTVFTALHTRFLIRMRPMNEQTHECAEEKRELNFFFANIDDFQVLLFGDLFMYAEQRTLVLQRKMVY